MQAPRDATPTLARRSLLELAGDFARLVALALSGMLCLLGLVLYARHWAGSLRTPLEPVALAGAAAGAAAAALAARLLWRAPRPRRPPTWLDRAVLWLPAGGLLLAGVAVVVPGTHSAGVGVFWVIVAAEEIWAWRSVPWSPLARRRRGRRSGPENRPPDEAPLAAPPAATAATGEPAPSWHPPAAATAGADERTLQQLTRMTTDDGCDVLRGSVRTRFEAGQRAAAAHVAFCPPFAHVPQLDYRQVDGPPARIKVGQLVPYGARLDIKLGAPAAEPVSLLVEFSAVCK